METEQKNILGCPAYTRLRQHNHKQKKYILFTPYKYEECGMPKMIK